MRLLMTTDAVGGVWRYSVDAARALEARGWTVTLAVIGPDPSSTQQCEAAGLHVVATGLPLDWAGADRTALARAAGELAALADGYDAVQLNQPALAGLAHWPCPVLAAAHSCVATWWGAVERDQPLPEPLAWQEVLTREGLLAARAAVAPSAAFADALRLRHRLPVAPMVVHNGRFPCPAADAALPLPQAGASRGKFVLGCGRLWDRGKNFALLDALAPLIGLPVELYGACEGPNGERFAPGFARAHGQVGSDVLAARMAERPLFAAPSLYEPFGLAVLEAAMAGCALVLADIPTFRELWDGAALFADPRDADAWLRAFAVARRDHAALGERAMARAARYGVDAMADALDGVLRGVAA